MIDTVTQIVTDVDGTLINSTKRISRFTRQVLTQVYREYGVKVLIASSRMPGAIDQLRSELPASQAMVAYDGALGFVKARSEAPFVDHRIDCGLAKDIVQFGVEQDLHIGLFREDDWVVEEVDYWTLREVRGTRVWPSLGPPREVIAGWERDSCGIHKIMLRGPQEILEGVYEQSTERWGGAICSYYGGDTTLEIVDGRAGKWETLALVLDHMNLSYEEVIAFGDGPNDVEMLKSVGLGIAVANGVGEAVAASDEVTLANEEDGVAVMLLKYFSRVRDSLVSQESR